MPNAYPHPNKREKLQVSGDVGRIGRATYSRDSKKLNRASARGLSATTAERVLVNPTSRSPRKRTHAPVTRTYMSDAQRNRAVAAANRRRSDTGQITLQDMQQKERTTR